MIEGLAGLEDLPDRSWEMEDLALVRLLTWWCALPEVTRDALRKAAAAVRKGPNDPCPCGSGRKAKRCCGANVG